MAKYIWKYVAVTYDDIFVEFKLEYIMIFMLCLSIDLGVMTLTYDL